MKKNNMITVTIGSIVAVVVIAGIVIYAISANNNNPMSGDHMMNHNDTSDRVATGKVDMGSAMYKMYAQLEGGHYDRMFIGDMIAHHQGAVDMAKLALVNARHQEIKDMANDIISAQTKEIDNMTSWQKAWEYPVTSGSMMEDHSSMGMMDDMADMTDKLKGLTGDEFDKAFLALMIEHHQSAIDMSYPGQKNAQHEELKALTKAIVDTQSKEIEQMKQWQKEWGY